MRASLLLLLFLSPQNAPPADTFVSPAGKDTNAGTKEAPLATVTRARDLARERKRPATIVLRGGTHLLTEPLLLKSEDSGLSIEAFPGEKPVLSAGRPVTGWTQGARGVWTAPATGAFRQLFVDGKRATRARSELQRVQGEVSLGKQAKFKAKEGDVKPGWAARGDVEVVVLQSWAEMRSPIAAVDGTTVTLAGECAPSNREGSPRYWVENAPDLLDQHGEW
jgi:hypothetical protein